MEPDHPACLDAVARPESAADGQVDDTAGNMNQSSATDGTVQRPIGDEEPGSKAPQRAHSSTASSPSPIMTPTGSAGDVERWRHKGPEPSHYSRSGGEQGPCKCNEWDGYMAQCLGLSEVTGPM